MTKDPDNEDEYGEYIEWGWGPLIQR
jgi:hypothetical protein